MLHRRKLIFFIFNDKMEPINQDPSHCKLRTFYYNPNDKRLFVRSYFTDRFTLNYARPWAWIIIVVILAIMAGRIYTKIMGIP